VTLPGSWFCAVLSLQHMFSAFQLDARSGVWLALESLPFPLWKGFVVDRRPTAALPDGAAPADRRQPAGAAVGWCPGACRSGERPAYGSRRARRRSIRRRLGALRDRGFGHLADLVAALATPRRLASIPDS